MIRLLLCTCLASSAFAHGGTLASEALYYEGGELAAISSNFGLLTRRDDALHWTCFERLSVSPFLALYAEGTWFVSTRQGAFSSPDEGCNWSPIAGLPEAPSSARFYRFDDVLFALAQDFPVPGLLYQRRGDEFQILSAAMPAGRAVDVRRRADGSWLLLVQDGQQEAQVFEAQADAQNWSQLAVLEGLHDPLFLNLNLEPGAIAIAATRGRAGELWSLDSEGALTRRAQLVSPVTDGRSDGDEHWLLTRMGMALKAVGEGPFLATEGPKHCLALNGEQLVACDDLASGYLVLQRVADGWQSAEPFSHIVPSDCSNAPVCAEQWSGIERMIEAVEVVDAGPPKVPVTPSPVPPQGCSCSAVQPDLWLLSLFLLFVVRRKSAC
ncbi:MAG: hypothetical protein OSB21_08325 [Myxococcota bacterium]|nr:hypothetical protein [Myxococcota bacterium]